MLEWLGHWYNHHDAGHTRNCILGRLNTALKAT